MITGENYKRIDGNAKAKEIKSKIQDIHSEMAIMQNVNNVRNNGFDSKRHDSLVASIERLEFELDFC